MLLVSEQAYLQCMDSGQQLAYKQVHVLTYEWTDLFSGVNEAVGLQCCQVQCSGSCLGGLPIVLWQECWVAWVLCMWNPTHVQKYRSLQAEIAATELVSKQNHKEDLLLDDHVV